MSVKKNMTQPNDPRAEVVGVRDGAAPPAAGMSPNVHESFRSELTAKLHDVIGKD